MGASGSFCEGKLERGGRTDDAPSKKFDGVLRYDLNGRGARYS